MLHLCRLANRTKINQNNEEYNVRKFLCLLALCFTPLAAFADSMQLMHGNQCESDRYGDYDRLMVRGDYGISFGVPQSSTTRGTAMGRVRCHFTLPSMVTVLGSFLQVTVYDRHPDANIRCDLKFVNSRGKVVGEDYRTTSGSSSSKKELMVGPILFDSPGELYPLVTCDIPQNYEGNASHITSLRLFVGGE